MDNSIKRRPLLQSYTLAMPIMEFFSSISEDLASYRYVSATERRCFNLAYRFLPNESKAALISNAALLNYHKDLALQYAATRSFERIAIIDDIMVHGRGMSKFLCQLESLIESDLIEMMDQNGDGSFLTMDDVRSFRRCFVQAVDIFLFAKADGTLLLDDRYRLKMRSFVTLSENQLHDLSLQLSDALNRWGVANTSFVYSEHNTQLAEKLTIEQPLRIYDSAKWTQCNWEYNRESMQLFLRMYGEPEVRKISSIRRFPGRTKVPQNAWITSFTMIGQISSSLISEICLRIRMVLANDTRENFSFLLSLLSDPAPIVQPAKGQFLYFILSVIDLREFSDSVGATWHPTTDADIIQQTDLDKICRNFGFCTETFHEMSHLLKSPELLALLKTSIEPLLCNVEPLCINTPTEHNDSKYDTVNDEVGKIIYSIGIDAEENAVERAQNSRLYHPDSYQSLEYNGYIFPKDGILSLSQFHKEAQKKPELTNAYYRTAALLAIMDYGVVGLRIFQANAWNCQLPVCKAGEMSTFYGPRQLALAIPAFAILERNSRRIDMTRREAITGFLQTIDLDAFKPYLESDEYSEWETAYIPHIQKLQTEARVYVDAICRSGQSFEGWNFSNLTFKSNDEKCKNGKLWLKCQWILEKLALAYLKM